MFRRPWRRDRLIVGWLVLLALVGLGALDDNTSWSGHISAARVAAFVHDLADAVLWSFLLLLLAGWLRAWLETRSAYVSPTRHTSEASVSRSPESSPAPPWTDRWLRDWREAEAERLHHPDGECQHDGEDMLPRIPTSCRHGAPLNLRWPTGQLPVLRALSVSQALVQRGAEVSVTWCFEHCYEVVIDEIRYPACSEARIRIDESRRIEVVGRNRFGSTPVATAAVIAVDLSTFQLPTLATPPPVDLRTDISATIWTRAPVTQLLDDFWAAQDRFRPRPPEVPSGPAAKLVSVPSYLADRLRAARRTTSEEAK